MTSQFREGLKELGQSGLPRRVFGGCEIRGATASGATASGLTTDFLMCPSCCCAPGVVPLLCSHSLCGGCYLAMKEAELGCRECGGVCQEFQKNAESFLPADLDNASLHARLCAVVKNLDEAIAGWAGWAPPWTGDLSWETLQERLLEHRASSSSSCDRFNRAALEQRKAQFAAMLCSLASLRPGALPQLESLAATLISETIFSAKLSWMKASIASYRYPVLVAFLACFRKQEVPLVLFSGIVDDGDTGRRVPVFPLPGPYIQNAATIFRDQLWAVTQKCRGHHGAPTVVSNSLKTLHDRWSRPHKRLREARVGMAGSNSCGVMLFGQEAGIRDHWGSDNWLMIPSGQWKKIDNIPFQHHRLTQVCTCVGTFFEMACFGQLNVFDPSRNAWQQFLADKSSSSQMTSHLTSLWNWCSWSGFEHLDLRIGRGWQRTLVPVPDKICAFGSTPHGPAVARSTGFLSILDVTAMRWNEPLPVPVWKRYRPTWLSQVT